MAAVPVGPLLFLTAQVIVAAFVYSTVEQYEVGSPLAAAAVTFVAALAVATVFGVIIELLAAELLLIGLYLLVQLVRGWLHASA